MIADLDDHLRSRPPAARASDRAAGGGRFMGAGPVMATRGAAAPAVAHHGAGWLLTLVVLAVIAGIGAYLTAPRPGGGWTRSPPTPTAPTRW